MTSFGCRPDDITSVKMSTGKGYSSLKNDKTESTCCCTKPWGKYPWYGKACIVLVGIVIVLAVVIGTTAGVFSVYYPLHASCKITWSVNASCAEVQLQIVKQIKDWRGAAGCNGTQRCLYLLKSNTAGKTLATHETPKKHYIDDLTFDFATTAAGTCEIKGFSTSETWYAVLDRGTNYCNLHNLITGDIITGATCGSGDAHSSGTHDLTFAFCEGAKIDQLLDYSESTNNSICTQYSKRNCDVY